MSDDVFAAEEELGDELLDEEHLDDSYKAENKPATGDANKVQLRMYKCHHHFVLCKYFDIPIISYQLILCRSIHYCA